MPKKILYSEPESYFPKDIRDKYFPKEIKDKDIKEEKTEKPKASAKKKAKTPAKQK